MEVGTPGEVAARVGETGKMVGVVEAREERRVLVVAHSAAKGATRPEPTGAAVAAREEAPDDGETANGGPQQTGALSERGPSTWDGSSTSSCSSSRSNTDHGEVTVVAGKRQVIPSLVDIASTAERLSKLTVE